MVLGMRDGIDRDARAGLDEGYRSFSQAFLRSRRQLLLLCSAGLSTPMERDAQTQKKTKSPISRLQPQPTPRFQINTD